MAAAAAAALTNSPNTALRLSSAIKGLAEQRIRQRRVRQDATEMTALDQDVRAQIDEAFLVLALLGESLLPLNIYDNNFYPATLGEVEASILSGGHDLMPMGFGELSAELQYAVTAGLAFCSCFAPMPVYRGFGAAVLNDWDWGCPDMETLMRKLKAKTGVFLRLAKEKGPQANRAVLQAFDQVIQMLQVKQVAFLAIKPSTSGFASEQPRFLPRKEKEVHREIDVQEEWTKKVEKLGHPAPPGRRVATWAMPFATWSSPFSCQLLKSCDSWETIMTNQMDPGRLLHAFICRNSLDVGETQLLVLAPHSPAESLACWLEGLPGMTHRIMSWADFDTELFLKKSGKSLRSQLGHFPLPEKFVMRNPNARPVHRPSLPSLPTSPATDNAISPPPCTNEQGMVIVEKRAEPMANEEFAAVELAADRAPVELASTTERLMAATKPSSTAPLKARPARQMHHAASTSALVASKQLSSALSEGVSTLRSLTGVRKRSPEPTVCHPAALVPGERPKSSSSEWVQPTSDTKTHPIVSGTISKPDGPREPVRKPTAMARQIPSVVISMPDEPATPSLDALGPQGAEVVRPVELSSEPVVHEIADTIAPLGTAAAPTPVSAAAQQTAETPEASSSHLGESQRRQVGDVPAHAKRKIVSMSDVTSSTVRVEEERPNQEQSAKSNPRTDDSIGKADRSDNVSGPSSNHTYLELLNKVASGEISPQALQQILFDGATPRPAPSPIQNTDEKGNAAVMSGAGAAEQELGSSIEDPAAS